MSSYHRPTLYTHCNTSCLDVFWEVFFFFFQLVLQTLLDGLSGPLSTLDLAHKTKLCKDTGGEEVNTVILFRPDTQRFSASQEVGQTRTANGGAALQKRSRRDVEKQSQSRLSSSLEKAREGRQGKEKKKVLQIHPREIPSFRDRDLFSRVHYLWKKAAALPNQLKGADRMEGLKNKCAADKSV